VAVAESAPQADTRSVWVIRTTVDNILTDTARREGLSAMAEPIVVIYYAEGSHIKTYTA